MELNKKCNCDDKFKRGVFDDPKGNCGVITVACMKCGGSYKDSSKLKNTLRLMDKKDFLIYAKKFCKA